MGPASEDMASSCAGASSGVGASESLPVVGADASRTPPSDADPDASACPSPWPSPTTKPPQPPALSTATSPMATAALPKVNDIGILAPPILPSRRHARHASYRVQ